MITGATPGSWTCENTCKTPAGVSLASNGVCEDGGAGSSASTCGIGTDCTDCAYRPSTSACASGWGYRFWKSNGKNGVYGHFCYAKKGDAGCEPALTDAGWKARAVDVVTPENDASLISTYCGSASATDCKVCKMAANIPTGFYNKGSPPGATISTTYGNAYDIALCNAGEYNDEEWSDPTSMTACKQCKAGNYGAETASLEEKSRGACSGSCAPGYYCVAGSKSNQAQPCRAGHYGAGGSQTVATCDGKCPVGYWCPEASVTDKAHKCRAGYFGDAEGQSSDTCVGECPAGYVCPAGTATVGVSPSAACIDKGNYCPKKSIEPLAVPAGHMTTLDSNGRAVSVEPCTVGTWCVNGVVAKCAAGKFGASTGLQTNECSGSCSSGYYCPIGSKSAVEEECGNLAVRAGENPVKYYCPAGVGTPIAVSTGYYTACADDSTTLCPPNRRTKQLPCQAGFLCAGGVQKRAVQWDPSICTCTRASDGTDNCRATDPDTSDGDIILNEQPAQDIPPWGTKSHLTWGRSVKATWFDETGTEGAVTKFTIANLRRHDFSTAAAAKTCALGSGTSASLARFRLDPTLSGTDNQRVQYMLDFEDCMGWAFDLVAESGTTAGAAGATKATATCQFTFQVKNLNDMPYWGEAVQSGDRYGRANTAGVLPFLAARRKVTERSPANTLVGAALAVVDPDDGQEVRFVIDGGDGKDMFRINSCSGQLYVAPTAAAKGGLDYKVQQSYTLRILVSDDATYFVDQASLSMGVTIVHIDIEDVNDEPVICVDASTAPAGCGGILTSLEMYEDAQPGGDTTIPAFGSNFIIDLDGDAVVYSIDPGAFDADMFQIDASTGTITVAPGKSLDYESKQLYRISIVVRDVDKDGKARGGEDKHTFSIAILDANDAPVIPSDIVLHLPENSPISADTSDTFAGTDIDSGSGSLIYSIVSQKGPDGKLLGADMFTLGSDGSGAQMKASVVSLPTGTPGIFDYESTACPAPCRYTLGVKVKDRGISGSAGCGSHCNSKETIGVIVVEITDVNEPPALTKTAVEVKENVETSKAVATLTGTDPEGGSLLYFVKSTRELGSDGGCNPGGRFTKKWLSVTSGGTLQSLLPMDFETLASNPFCVEIKVQDQGGLTNLLDPTDGKESYQAVKVTVKNVNEPPVVAASQELSVYENTGASPAVDIGNVVFTDPDSGDVVTVAITKGGDFGGVTYLRLKPGTNTVQLVASPDFETTPSFTLDVTATDAGKLVGTGAITVKISDVNEAPQFASNTMNFLVSEHNNLQVDCTTNVFCLPGTEVGVLLATDQDKINGKVESVTYILNPSSNGDGTFVLNSASGVLSVNRVTTALMTRGHKFSLNIVAKDSRKRTSDPVTVVVTVVERNFVPRFTPGAAMAPVKEGAAGAGATVGTIEVVDPDSNYPLTVSIRQTDPPGYWSAFNVVPLVGGTTQFTLKVAADSELDFETIPSQSNAGAPKGQICLTMDAIDSAGATVSYAGNCVQVVDVNEPPSVAVSLIKTAEGDAVGKIGEIQASDADAADQTGTGKAISYSIDSSGWAKPCPFSLKPVPCASDAKQTCADVYVDTVLDYESLATDYGAKFDPLTSTLAMVITVTDSKPNTVSATVTVEVADVNEAPTLNMPVAPLTVLEGTGVGAVLATIPVSDPDDVLRNLAFEVTVVGAAAGAPTLVTVEPAGRNAVIKLADAGSLDFENAALFKLQVDVDDGGNGNKGEPSRKSRHTINLQVQNANDVTITSLAYKTPGTLEGHPTVGGDIVVLTGTNFGPTQNKITTEGAGATVPTVVVKYGALTFTGVKGDKPTLSATDSFVAKNCKVTKPNTEIECASAPLDRQIKATDLHWFVQIGGDLSVDPSTQTTQYLAPTITSVTPTKTGGMLMWVAAR